MDKLQGVYVVLVGPDISEEPVRWCFANEADADRFCEIIGENSWVSYEPIAYALSEMADYLRENYEYVEKEQN